MDSIALDPDAHSDLFAFDNNFQPDWTIPAYTPLEEPFLAGTSGISSPVVFEPIRPVENTEGHGLSQPLGDNSRELLAFHTLPESRRCLLNTLNEPTICDISARLSGMLFVAQDASEDSTHGTSGLTCYRRNMLKVFGHAFIPRGVRLPATEGQTPLPISNVVASLSACETLADETVRLVVPPAKNATRQQNVELEESEPEPIKLDMAANPDRYSEPCPFNVSWDRLHFRHATTKSNRRNAPQQRFRLVLEIKCIANGEHVTLCKAVSVPIDVRGRSPKSYITQTDVRPSAKRPRYNSNGSYSIAEPAAPLSESFDLPGANTIASQSSISPTTNANANIANDDWISNLLAGNHDLDFNELLLSQGSHQSVTRIDDTFEGVLAGLAETKCGSTEGKLTQATPGPFGCSNEDLASSAEESETVSSKQDAEHSYEYFPLSALDWTTPAEAVYV